MKAIDQAKKFIFVVDWSFHPFFKPRMGSGMSPTIGAMLLDKAKAGVTVQGVFETTGSQTPFSEYTKMKKAGLAVL